MKIKGRTYYNIRFRNSADCVFFLLFSIWIMHYFDLYIPIAVAAVLMVLCAARALYIRKKQKAEEALVEKLRQSGRKYEAEYFETIKAGSGKKRIKVIYRNPLTGEEKYFFSTDILYDPKIFIPDITKITVYADYEDEEVYFVDFHDSLPENEAVKRI